jgi:3-deoxy-manno-octulosonate cytidylyltransferase (CMP-KDO synthetase)
VGPRPSGAGGGAPSLRAVALIPARLASTRLARKMLLADTGRPLVVHTAECARGSGAFARVVVATDAEEIAAAVRAHGCEARLTRADHASGTDRVHEAWSQLALEGERADVLVGIQGDEPDLAAADLARLVAAFRDPAVEMATLAAPLADAADLARPSVVKVVRDARGDALYFSRAPIPGRGHAAAGAAPLLRHVGVYAYRPAALARFCALPHGALERWESLEQLRWLEAGLRLRVVDATRAPRGIDTEEDYRAFVARAGARPAGAGGGAGAAEGRSGIAGARSA